MSVAVGIALRVGDDRGRDAVGARPGIRPGGVVVVRLSDDGRVGHEQVGGPGQ